MVPRLLAAFASLILFFLTTASDGGGAKEGAKKLEGTWLVQSASTDGKPIPAPGGKMVFAGDSVTVTDNGKDEKGFFTVDPSRKPATIDLSIPGLAQKGKQNSRTQRGIYELKGDTLRLCFAAFNKRPTEFSDKGQLLLVLKRKKS